MNENIMKEDIQNLLKTYDEQTMQRFHELRELIYESSIFEPQEKLWAKIPSYYVEDKFVRIIPFKDHFNIETKAVISHQDELIGYKITPKGMLQIFHDQQLPKQILKNIFNEGLRK